MATGKANAWRVRSCSSESSVHKADNVLVPELYRFWNTSEPAEEAWILLEARVPVAIDGLEIVNAGSYLVEVHGVSEEDSTENDDHGSEWELLLSSQQLMSLKDLQSNANRNRAFNFTSPRKLSTDASKKRWKLLKIFCRQPFGVPEHRTCIGLSRISIFSCNLEESVISEMTTSQLSNSLHGGGNADGFGNDKLGDVKKRKLPSWNQDDKGLVPGSEERVVEDEASCKYRAVKRLSVDCNDEVVDMQKNLDYSDGDQVTSLNRQAIKTGHLKNRKNSTDEKIIEDESSEKMITSSTSSQGHDADQGVSVHNAIRAGSPFSMLLDGVIFAISGLVNPERANLRSQALAMGAEYQPDWNSRCTLLVCAFPNTPKFKQVKGDGGTIVSKEWITECYRCKRLVDISSYLMHSGKPWNKQLLNANIVNDNSSYRSSVEAKIDTKKTRQNLDDCKQIGSTRSNLKTKPTFNIVDVQKWAVEDLKATMSWLQDQEEPPPMTELKEIAIQGILACLDDAVNYIKHTKKLQDLHDTWEWVPRVAKELAAYDSKMPTPRVTQDELLTMANAYKNIYESEFKKDSPVLQNSKEREETGSNTKKGRSENVESPGFNKDDDSEDTIVMDEDEIESAECASSH